MSENAQTKCQQKNIQRPVVVLIFQIINSMESWLSADPENVAVVHCLTGRGRTVTVLACFLAWVGEFETATEALSFVCERLSAASAART